MTSGIECSPTLCPVFSRYLPWAKDTWLSKGPWKKISNDAEIMKGSNDITYNNTLLFGNLSGQHIKLEPTK